MTADTTALASPESAGWFGKLPMLGDFAHRRLPVTIVRRCDEWLAESLAASRASLGAQWLETYLSSPVWCFAWAPRVVDDAWWIGVLMPSVDAVGRYFPLMVASRVDPPPRDEAGLHRLGDWYRAAAAAVLSTLEPGATFERFEAALAGLVTSAEADQAAVDDVDAQALDVPEGVPWPDQAPVLAWPAMLRAMSGRSVWWPLATTAGSANAAPMQVHWSQGLPAPDRFEAMLDGRS